MLLLPQGGQRLNSNDTYFYQVAFDPTKQNKQDKDFNGDFKPFVIGYIPVDLDLPSSFLNLVLTGLEAGLIRMSFSPSFKLLEGAEGALPARVKNWEKHKGTLDEYKINKRNETVHPLNRNPGGEARADTTGTRDYSEQVRVAAAAEGMETSKKRGQDRAAALKDYNTGMDFEEKSKIVRPSSPAFLPLSRLTPTRWLAGYRGTGKREGQGREPYPR